ncbi:putative ADP-ribose pyrophosphatase [Podospora conica]|nr:putative ADP-ribose pyrophosphatase [Schizothecium conicum]
MASLSKAKVVSVKPLENKDARWLNIVQIEYQGADGEVRTWEAMRRTTRPKDSPVDAVHIIATRNSAEDLGIEVLLEKQFRPPAGKVVIEFPAGLVDPDETLEECALRELKEETGYLGEVVRPGGIKEPLVFHSAPASSFSCAATINVRINTALPENQNPQPHLEENEFIECFWVPVKDIYAELRRLQADGYAIDGKVGAFAEGIETSKMLQS